MKIKRTDSGNTDFIEFVHQLDAELASRDGDQHSFYAQFNKIDQIKHAIVIYEGDSPIGCGAIKPFAENTMEIKRMYTLPACRGKGIASRILLELDALGFPTVFVEVFLSWDQPQRFISVPFN